LPDKIPFYPSSNADGFRNVGDETDLPRALLEHHFLQDPTGRTLYVHPGSQVTLADLVDQRTGGVQPVIMIAGACTPAAFAVILMPHEMRVLAESLNERADEIEKSAMSDVGAVFDKIRKGDD